jgi:hypothetical protein
VIIGEGGLSSEKPDALARDQLYVFGRMNSSWDMTREDFLGFAATLSADGIFGDVYWDESAGSTARAQTVTSAGISGVARLDFSTPGANASSLLGSNGINVTQRSLNPVFEARILGTNGNNHRIIAGFADGNSGLVINSDTNQRVNEAFFRKTAAGTVWQTVTRSANGTETINLTAIPTDVYQTLRVELNDTLGTADFYINGVLQFSHSTSVPATAAGLGYYIGNGISSATNRFVDVDYIRVWSDDPANIAIETIADSAADNALTIDEDMAGAVPITDVLTTAQADLIDSAPADENESFIEELFGQFAVNMREYFAHVQTIITDAVVTVGELITPKATVRELCIE